MFYHSNKYDMKLYIPTSSLNLDNILQAESISPLSFYAQRKTGYKSIELIEEVKQFPNHIVLFDHPVLFTIHDPGRDNFPLLIEIEVDCKQFNIERIDDKGVYLCGRTIDLTPMNSNFFFFSEIEYKMTIINTKDNRSIKYYKDYSIFPTTSSLKLKDLDIIPNCSNIAVEKSQETVKDKVKGAFYAYFLGQELSLEPGLAHMVKLTQDLYDALTSIISVPHAPDILLKHAECLYKEYKSIDPVEKKNKIEFDKKYRDECKKHNNSPEGFSKQLGEERWSNYKESKSKKWECDLLPNFSLKSLPIYSPLLRDKIESHTNQAIKDWQKGKAKPTDEGCCLENGTLLLKGKHFINRVVDFIIKKEITANYISVNRLLLCKELVNVIKGEIVKEKGLDYWEKSDERTYFGDLFRHIKDPGKEFNLKGIDNEELISIAVFLLRGESYKGLTSYIKLNELCDYRNIFFLWGALCGYMEMDRNIFPANILTLEVCGIVNQHLFCFSMKAKELENSVSVDKIIVADYLEVLKIIDAKDHGFDKIIKLVEGLDDNNIEKWIRESLPKNFSQKEKRRLFIAKKTYSLVLHKNERDTFDDILGKLKDKKITIGTLRNVAQYFGYVFSKEKPNKGKQKNQKETNAGQEFDLFRKKY